MYKIQNTKLRNSSRTELTKSQLLNVMVLSNEMTIRFDFTLLILDAVQHNWNLYLQLDEVKNCKSSKQHVYVGIHSKSNSINSEIN